VELPTDKIFCCLAVIILMGHDVQDIVSCSLVKQLATSYSNLVKIMKREHFACNKSVGRFLQPRRPLERVEV
jgi:hypothetical protein